MTPADTVFIPQVETVPQAIAWWAVATPDAPALLGIRGETLSHAQLHTRIEEFARQLAALGIELGDRVLLALPDGVPTAIAGLATIRTAVAVPVNPAQSRAEAESIIASVTPRVVIVAHGAETAFRDVARHPNIPVVALDAAGLLQLDVNAPLIRPEPLNAPAPDDIAMILLTSGTTDVPQRVPATHGNVLATCSARTLTRGMSPRDRGLSTAPAYFVLGLARVIEPLISGGSVIVTTALEVVRQPETIRELAPTWAWMSPGLLETVLEAAEENPTYRAWPLRFVRSGGALVTPELIARAQALWGVPVLSGYGTTETLGFIAAEESPETIPRKPGSVGLARPGLEIAIRTTDGEPLPEGTVGEITVRGPGVFSGYLGDPEATAAAFFPGGWYRTGDLGYLDDEGYLFVTGRLREMINRGGEKIAPTEIDEVLRTHPAVADAAAFAIPDSRLGEEVAAAVVLREKGAVDARSLRRWVAGRLSPHKVPRRIWFVGALPRTGSGKVQRGALTVQYRSHDDD
jgi:acyl-CoA synthetase (AMP-forming)/AMP-acid ligase II